MSKPVFIPAKKCKKCKKGFKIFWLWVEKKTGYCAQCFSGYKK